MSDSPDLKAVYAELREYVIDVLAPLDDDARSVTVPACPAWTIHDLVAHVTHVAGAIAMGDHAFGSAERTLGADAAERARHFERMDAWTEAGVQARRDMPFDALVDEWRRSSDQLGDMIDGHTTLPDETFREKLVWTPTLDLVAHAGDLCAVIGVPMPRDLGASKLSFSVQRMLASDRATSHDGEPLVITTERGDLTIGDPTDAPTVEVDWWELLRTMYGRRSRDQINELLAPIDPTPYLEILTEYPIAEHDQPG